jgi:hypothetical protein
MGISVGSCEHGNGTMGSTRCEEFLDWFNNYQIPKEDSALRSWFKYCHTGHKNLLHRNYANSLQILSGLKQSVDLMAFQVTHKGAPQNNKIIDSAKNYAMQNIG